jgi:hypothetical protein
MSARASLSVAALLVAASAAAHHSYSAFDMSKTIAITGTVSKWEWTNPHNFLYVDSTDSVGAVHSWRIESVSPVMMAKAGFSRKTFQVGDKITVTAHPGRGGELYRANFVGAKLANGKELTMGLTPDSAPVDNSAASSAGSLLHGPKQ